MVITMEIGSSMVSTDTWVVVFDLCVKSQDTKATSSMVTYGLNVVDDT